MIPKPNIDTSCYRLGSYSFEERFISFYWQLTEVLAQRPSSILEVGVGNRVFGSYIKNNTEIKYTSVDIAEDLHPDVIGSILELPFANASFDVACAFEVLEHLPFEQFDRALIELCRVARTHIVISVPHFGPMLSFSFKIPFLPHIRLALKIPFLKKHLFNGHHYWEIGKKGYPVSLIRKKLFAYGEILRDFVPFGSPYHHFFVVRLPEHNKKTA